jgi:hypothetical protein
MAASSNKLTKAETVALWHAVSNYELMVRQMKNVEGITPEQLKAEKERLALARSALRKANKLREYPPAFAIKLNEEDKVVLELVESTLEVIAERDPRVGTLIDRTNDTRTTPQKADHALTRFQSFLRRLDIALGRSLDLHYLYTLRSLESSAALHSHDPEY